MFYQESYHGGAYNEQARNTKSLFKFLRQFSLKVKGALVYCQQEHQIAVLFLKVNAHVIIYFQPVSTSAFYSN